MRRGGVAIQLALTAIVLSLVVELVSPMQRKVGILRELASSSSDVCDKNLD